MVVPSRSARLVLVTPSGVVRGALPPVPVATPWWPEMAPVVQAARDRFGIDIVVLRMLHADRDEPPGGTVTYLAETTGSPAGLESADVDGRDHPLRMPWARPGGPAADLVWAHAMLRRAGRTRTGPPAQIRSWNLSSLWRIPMEGGVAWLKHVPPFFSHEGAVIGHLQDEPVPRLIASETGRILMEEIPGTDLYDADAATLSLAIDLLAGMQHRAASRVDELLALGLPDWRADALASRIRDVVARAAGGLTQEDRALLDAFVGGLPERWEAISACGIPDALVHGDFGPNNLRGDDGSLVILDWGDSGIGHPLLDQPSMLDRVPRRDRLALAARWAGAWTGLIPGCDPVAAARLIAPVAAARQAVVYQSFLDRIDPAEQPYHRRDPQRCLAATAALLRAQAWRTKAAPIGRRLRGRGDP